MDQETGREPRRFEEEQAALRVKHIARRAKLLRQARTQLYWSDGLMVVVGFMCIGLAFWTLNDIETYYKAYNMQRLTPMRLLSPALYFVLGLMSTTQGWISSMSRRVDALRQLVEDSQGT